MAKSKSFAERLDQAKMIGEAMFLNKETSHLDYHQKRLKICEACPYNSDNTEDKTALQKVREDFVGKAVPYFSKRYCTACGCPIDKKVGIARAICGRVDLNEEPLWLPVEASGGTQTTKDKVITLEGDSGATVYFEKDAFICEFPETSSDLLTVTFVVDHLKSDPFITAWPTCSCTVPEVEKISDTKVRIKAQLSTQSFPVDATSTRDLTLAFKNSKFVVRFKVRKIQK